MIASPEIVRLLSQHLGRRLLAITIDASPVDVDRLASGALAPSQAQERRLRDSHQVWQTIISVDSPETTRAWWMGMKEQLGDLSPAEAIAADRTDAVKSIALDFIEGG